MLRNVRFCTRLPVDGPIITLIGIHIGTAFII